MQPFYDSYILRARLFLHDGLQQFVSQRLRDHFGNAWWEQGVLPVLTDHHYQPERTGDAPEQWFTSLDSRVLLKIIKETRHVFSLPPDCRRFVNNVFHSLNQLAHEKHFDRQATQETLEWMQDLLTWMGMPTQAHKVKMIAKQAMQAKHEELSLDPDVAAARQLDEAKRRLATLPRNAVPAPAPLPPGSRVPFAPNPHFVGRTSTLSELGAALQDGQARVITAPASYGKTQLAAEVAHRYGPYFAGGVHWVACADPDAIPMSIAECGAVMHGLPEFYGKLPLDERVRLVVAAWEEPTPRLIIFDNCEDPELVARWRPRSTAARVLVTSRQRQWPSALGVGVCPLALLDHDASIALLRRHRPDLAADDGDLNALADLLDGFPLALHLAGSYLERQQGGESVATYLSSLRATDVLWHQSLVTASPYSPTAYNRPIASTLAVAFQQLDPAHPIDAVARLLFARAAHFAPGAPINVEVLYSTIERVFNTRLLVQRPLFARYEQAINRLVDLGLVGWVTGDRPVITIISRNGGIFEVELDENETSLTDRDYGAIRVHRLVAAFARERADDLMAHAAVIDSLRAIGDMSDEIGAPEIFASMDVHLRHVTMTALQSGYEHAARLAELTGCFLLSIGDASAALPYLEQAVEVYRERSDDPETWARCLACIADAYTLLGDLDHAWEVAQEAHANRIKAMKPVGESLRQLGVLLHRRGDLDAATTMLHHALIEAQHDDFSEAPHDDFSEALVYTPLGSVMLTKQKWNHAAWYYRKAIELSADIIFCGWFPAEQAIMHHGLGVALRELGQYEDARKELEHALQIRIDAGLEYHPDMIATLHDLARLGLAASWWEETEAWLAQANDHIHRAGSAGHTADHLELEAKRKKALPRRSQQQTRDRKSHKRNKR
ncbi:tetratricopeptide repeat protein [Oscillochloris sp. ZM17-4]|uniref:tetratricopeptide repeat protein n=1 Tax=Oscillochloris sp. ZM17-4 TaxID=2866714 RepID=UPI001C729EDE|nr:tetratricopeptide repeat protein [Oscillochloris sp. ZM17-4]MBX0330519.1 tetratricopeptide repeat protein [Oscillochloris sp. ZM17-4]